jgi:F-type H+-transporting ATPase subunit a
MALLGVFLYAAARQPKLVPQGAQNIMEIAVEQFSSLINGVMDDEKQTRKFLPLVLGIFLFVLTVNWVGLIPGFGTVGGHHGETFVPLLRAGSSDLNLTLVIAGVSFFTAQMVGIGAIGFFRYGGKFLNFSSLTKRPFKFRDLFLFIPTFLLGLIELISEVAKLISLSFRLFGNIYAGEVLLVVFGFLLPVFIPISAPFYILEVLVGLIQAFVFAMLTIVFIKIATINPEH